MKDSWCDAAVSFFRVREEAEKRACLEVKADKMQKKSQKRYEKCIKRSFKKAGEERI